MLSERCEDPNKRIVHLAHPRSTMMNVAYHPICDAYNNSVFSMVCIQGEKEHTMMPKLCGNW
jgi:hypothetical protein